MTTKNENEKKRCSNDTLDKIGNGVEKVSEEVKEEIRKVKDKYNSLEPETKKKLWTGLSVAAGLLALRSIFKKKNKD